MPNRNKLLWSRNRMAILAEDQADYTVSIKDIEKHEQTYTLDEVIRMCGLDKYHLQFRTKRLQKKHRLEWNATQK